MALRIPNRARFIVIAGSLMALSWVAGCSSAQDGPQSAQHSANRTPTATTDDHTAATPSSQSSPDAVLQQYFDAIGAGRFDDAYALWQTGTREAPDSPAALESRYDGISAVRMKVTGDVRREGAAGTLYATVPITVTEQADSGHDKSLSGQCVLARSNNVPGSSDKARRWHLHSCDLS